ncbi:TPA: cupin domain-containing protein [Providencia alcalifaciens]
MEIYRSKEFTGNKAWQALDIANFDGTTVRLHWTDKAYKWHVNDGQEVFVVLDGSVEMHYKEELGVKKIILNTGDIFYASVGTEHVAHPVGVARILVIEKEGSV